MKHSKFNPSRPLQAGDRENYKGQVSKTMPDQSMSIREILNRFTTGRPVDNDIQKQPLFTDTVDFDAPDLSEFQFMDHNEREQVRRDLMHHANELRANARREYESFKAQKLNKQVMSEDEQQDDSSRPGTPSRRSKKERRRSDDRSQTRGDQDDD